MLTLAIFLIFAFVWSVVMPELPAPFRLPVLPTRRTSRALVWTYS